MYFVSCKPVHSTWDVAAPWRAPSDSAARPRAGTVELLTVLCYGHARQKGNNLLFQYSRKIAKKVVLHLSKYSTNIKVICGEALFSGVITYCHVRTAMQRLDLSHCTSASTSLL